VEAVLIGAQEAKEEAAFVFLRERGRQPPLFVVFSKRAVLAVCEGALVWEEKRMVVLLFV
jgi:hypothetical protein